MIVRERATRGGVRVSLSSEPGRRDGRRRRAPDQAGRLQSALERGQVHAGGRRPSTSPRRSVDGEVRVSVTDTGPGHRPGGPGTDLRGVPAGRRGQGASARGRASGWRCRSASSSCTAGGSGSTASSGRAARSCSRSRSDRRSRWPRADPGRRGQREEHEAASRRAPGDRLSNARGIDRGTGADAGERASTRARADGHPAAGHGRPRGAAPAADGRAHRLDPGARRDRPGDEGRPRAIHGGGFRRLSLEAGRHRRAPRDRRAALRGRRRFGHDRSGAGTLARLDRDPWSGQGLSALSSSAACNSAEWSCSQRRQTL